MATHCSILAWRIPQTEEPGGLQPMGSQRVGYNCETDFCFHFLAFLVLSRRVSRIQGTSLRPKLEISICSLVLLASTSNQGRGKSREDKIIYYTLLICQMGLWQTIWFFRSNPAMRLSVHSKPPVLALS